MKKNNPTKKHRLHTTLRNIGVIAHVDAGKTTVTERLLYHTGKTHGMGETHEGRAVMDFGEQESKHGITISSAATSILWKDHQINLIDTPGHIDFNIEVKRALRVLDGAVVVFDAVAGVEPQTETNWRLADDFGVPRIAFVNKMDRSGADFRRTCEDMRKRLGAHIVPVQIPMGAADKFDGIIDLLERQLVSPARKDSREMHILPIPDSIRTEVEKARLYMIEQIAEVDDSILELVLNDEPISNPNLHEAIRKMTIQQKGVPVLCGAALRNSGIPPLLDSVVSWLPSPADLEPPGESKPHVFCGYVFKTVSLGNFGEVAMTRVYSGSIEPGETIINSTNGRKERISRIVEIHAEQMSEKPNAQTGDIIGIFGLKHSDTGHTLCAPTHLIELESLVIPDPVTSVAVEAVNREQSEKLSVCLNRIGREDPTLRISTDPESGQTRLSGMGELHLEMVREKLESVLQAPIKFGAPEVSYRETLAETVEVDLLHRKQDGGSGQFARVVIRFEPLPRGGGFEFIDEIKGGAIASEYISSVRKGIESRMTNGPKKGAPFVDFRAVLLDGQIHSQDSSQLAFKVAGGKALAEAMDRARIILLEPIMEVTVVCPTDHLGDIIGDINRRKGMVIDQLERDDINKIVIGHVPLASLFGYIGDLRSLTSGRAEMTMTFDHYSEAAG